MLKKDPVPVLFFNRKGRSFRNSMSTKMHPVNFSFPQKSVGREKEDIAVFFLCMRVTKDLSNQVIAFCLIKVIIALVGNKMLSRILWGVNNPCHWAAPLDSDFLWP